MLRRFGRVSEVSGIGCGGLLHWTAAIATPATIATTMGSWLRTGQPPQGTLKPLKPKPLLLLPRHLKP